MNLFDYMPEPLLLLVIGVTSLLFGLVLHATRDVAQEEHEENAADASVEISHVIARRAHSD